MQHIVTLHHSNSRCLMYKGQAFSITQLRRILSDVTKLTHDESNHVI